MASKFKYALSLLLLVLTFWSCAPAAQAAPVKAYTPDAVKDSVYMIYAYQDGHVQWSGTGWKIAEDALVTAGHVCDTEGEDGFKFRAISRWNQEYPVTVARFSREPDLCIMLAPHIPGGALSELTWNPGYSEPVWYSGAPVGVFGDGTVPFAQGFYIGGNKCMIAGYPGASGSPMYTEDGVFGILVAGWTGTHIIEFVPAYVLVGWLKE